MVARATTITVNTRLQWRLFDTAKDGYPTKTNLLCWHCCH